MIIKVQEKSEATSARLAECERVIAKGLSVFFEVGQALAEIRDGKLYRDKYATFEAYCDERWNLGRSRAYELIDQAVVVAKIADSGVNLSAAADISKRDVRTLKKNLPAAAKDIKRRVAAGQEPASAVKATVEAKRAEQDKAKAKQKAEKDQHERERQAAADALPQAIKNREAAKKTGGKNNGAADASSPFDQFDRIKELEEANRSLETEIEALRAENKLYGEMKVQFEQGGFAKVVAGKDNEIAALETRLYRESADKDSWRKLADWWKQQAIKLGWQKDEVIPLNEPEAS